MSEKGEIVSVDSWVEDGDIMIIINYEDGGYDEKRIYGEEVEQEFDYIPEGC